MTALDDAKQSQVLAADPSRSTWLSANAGSGKTRVLTDRVARLLLDGSRPETILCLTYTKAAAGEMQNRLFRTLGEWAMMPDNDLALALGSIGAHRSVDLARARTLFARAIETPGGLKIQTIHSFCAALLRQFPLEAGVSPGFVEMDESMQRHLLGEILEDLSERDPGGVVSELALHHSGQEIDKFVAELVGKRHGFGGVPDRKDLLAQYGVSSDLTKESLLEDLDLDPGLFLRLLGALKSSKTTDLKARDSLSSIDPEAPGLSGLATLERILLTGEGANDPFSSKAGRFPTKEARGALAPSDLDDLDDLMDRIEEIRRKRLALESADRTIALHRFANELLPAYEAEKAERALLDFDDLILRATHLLGNPENGPWILFKLDARIEHVLVDESQDTSLAQWRLIEHLTGEFGSGEGTRSDEDRTLFVVGDKKQSIYSFQGADAAAFDMMHARLSERLAASGGLSDRKLVHSFRSAPAILNAVDATFSGDSGKGLGEVPHHIALHGERAGRVDLWPPIAKPEVPERTLWYEPVDLVANDHPSAVLANKVAEEIKRLIADPSSHVAGKDGPRRITAGDILILVRGRTGQGQLFDSLIRACKEAGLPVAGADVMRLDEEMAVRDLKALLAFLALPEDSLSLAALLRSPLFCWSEDALYRLAAGRSEEFLWRTLQNRECEHPDTVRVLRDLRDRADFMRPYDLLERVLVRHDARRKLVARLGPECEDAIDQMLSLALSYERQEVPSLTGFLAWLDGEANVVKRSPHSAGDAVRVMTVHGAKGLEAPVVILPDTMRTDQRERDQILLDEDGLAHWPGVRSERPRALERASETASLRNDLERDRLLYVAMTRAESWLIVCGAGDVPKNDNTWHAALRQGLERAGASPLESPVGPGLRLETGDWSIPVAPGGEAQSAPCTELPDWAFRPAPRSVPVSTLSPSDLGGAKALRGDEENEEDALRFGRRIHLLLEHLPGHESARRENVAVALLCSGEDAATEEEARGLARRVSALLARPELARVFDPDALVEVEVSAHVPDLGCRVHGVIDRLILEPGRALIVDFKTNARVPGRPEEVPEGILRQMAAYLSAVSQIYVDREIETAILWTTSQTLMTLPNDIVMKSLHFDAIS